MWRIIDLDDKNNYSLGSYENREAEIMQRFSICNIYFRNNWKSKGCDGWTRYN